MKYHFFHILAIDSQNETERLNTFLQAHPIHSIERQFVSDGSNSFWSICVITLARGASTKNTMGQKRSKIDYQALLAPEHFAIFSTLRNIRNHIATDHGIPPYAVFTNEQLSQISQLEPMTYDAISKMKGIGGKRLNVYTVNLLDVYNKNTINNNRE